MINQHLRISSKCFRDMILFSGKYGNRLMLPEDLKHAYGYVLGKYSAQGIIDILRFLPEDQGFRNEQRIENPRRKIDLLDGNLEVCGFFHAFPLSNNVLSDMDIASLTGFDMNALCIVFDFTKVDQYNNGFLVYQRDESYIKNTPYTITHPENEDKFYFARSLVDLSEKYELTGTLHPESWKWMKKFESQPSNAVSTDNGVQNSVESKFLVEIPEPSFEEYELSLIDQDFEVQKLRSDIDKASKEGKSSAYVKLQLANRLISHMAIETEILKYLESAEEEFSADQSSASKIGLAITKNELGLFYEDRGNYYTALNYFDDSFSILNELKETNKIVRVLNNIGNIYYKLNNFDIALKKYNEAYEKSNNLADKVLVYNNIADVYLKLRNYGRAFSILMKNAEFFQETQNDFGLSLVFSKLAKLYHAQGKNFFHLAKKYAHLALAVKKRNEFHRESIDDYKMLATIYLAEKNFRVAEDNLIQGLNLVRTLGLEEKEAFFYEYLGNLYHLENRFEESVEYYILAGESYEKFAESELQGGVLEKIGDHYSQNPHDISKAMKYYNNSLKLYEEEKLRRKQADILVKIAEIHIYLGEPTSAIECLQQAYTLYKIMYDDTTANIISERIKSLEY
jgi:tetratricopeptide (TPR) repeat protein